MFRNAKNGCIDLGDTQMSYVSFGAGEKSLILLPGLSDGLTTVKGKALLLAKPYKMFFEKYTVYMFSRRDSMPKGYTIRDMAEDQAKAMDLLGIREASLMGVSQGGMIAMELAINHPERINSLVLAVTAPCANNKLKECLQKWISLAMEGNHKALMIDTAEKSYSAEYLKKYRKMYPVMGFIGKPASYERFLINANAIMNFDAEDRLHRIQCPVLIIGGSEDQIVGVRASYEMHGKIPGSEICIYRGLGHAAYEEAKDFNTRVYRFLESAGNS